MSENKQTQCPQCLTFYHVSLIQLSLAQGMVCCPKCGCTFNALTYLVQYEVEPENKKNNINLNHLFKNAPLNTPAHISNLYNQKAQHSNIDLYTYLNSLKQTEIDLIYPKPNLNLSDQQDKKQNNYSSSHYLFWGVLNLVLLIFLTLQILISNARVGANLPWLAQPIQTVCSFVSCPNHILGFQFLIVEHVSIQAQSRQKSRISGQIFNQSTQDLVLPHLRLRLLNNKKEVFSQTYLPLNYVNFEHKTIQSISPNQPLSWQIIVPLSQKQFDEYQIEIVKP